MRATARLATRRKSCPNRSSAIRANQPRGFSARSSMKLPSSVEDVDFLAADAHKWLLGPCAAGIFFVRKSMQEKLRPPIYGWHNVRCPNYVAQEKLVYPPDARRYEAGSGNLLGMVGLHAALELLLDIGIDEIAAELLRKRALLVAALQAKGYIVLQADSPPAHSSGIVAFHKPS